MNDNVTFVRSNFRLNINAVLLRKKLCKTENKHRKSKKSPHCSAAKYINKNRSLSDFLKIMREKDDKCKNCYFSFLRLIDCSKCKFHFTKTEKIIDLQRFYF